MGVIDKLQRSEKGRLSYERETSPKALKDFLNTCTSPTSIHVSPQFTRSQKILEEQSEKNEDDPNKTYSSKPSSNASSASDTSLLISKAGTQCDISQKIDSQTFISPEFSKSRLAEFSKSRLAIQKYEEQLENLSKKALQEKKKLFEERKWRLEREAEIQLEELDQQANFNSRMKIQDIELRHRSHEAEINKQHRKLKENHEKRKVVHSTRMQEAEQTRERIRQEEQRQKELRRIELLDKISRCVTDLNSLNAKIQSQYSNCEFQDHISEAAKKSLTLIQTRVAAAEKIKVEFQQSGEPSIKLFEKCKDLLEQAGNAYEFVCLELDKAEKEGKRIKEEQEKQASLLKQQQEQQQQQQQQQRIVVGIPLAASTPAPSVTSSIITSNLSTSTLSELAEQEGATLCVYPETFTKYTRLQDKLTKVEEAITVLTSTPELKKLKFDIQKAVNTPMNAISPTSGEHLRDKLTRLLSLLSGQTVEVGNKQISLKQHPQASAFCKHLIAKMIVKKGQEQVSSKHESAFAIAMVVVGMWREQPDFGDLLLAQFYQACPYLVPYYIPKQEDQSNEDYFKSRGYLYDSDGTVEKQEKFLKRMTGIMRLYFSIMVSHPPRGNHPHGLEHAWSWFSQVLNLEPIPDITAAMIYDFLQVVGQSLYKKYNKQFLKLLHILVKEIIPQLDKVSSAAGSGSLSRLKLLLEASLRSQGQIPEPEGYLKANFWLS